MEASARTIFTPQQKFSLTITLLLISLGAYAQKPIRGIVIDSATFAPLQFVNIQIKNTSRGTTTDPRGEFRLLVKPTDTLIFSLIGYLKEEFVAEELEETTIIRMAEQIHLLQTIDVHPRGDEKFRPSLRLAPTGPLMNYSPNGGAGINFAYFSRLQREKRRLSKVIAEQDRQKNYIAVVTSPEVRERIIYDYNLTEDEYYQILAGFNLDNGNSLYPLSSEELITVMNSYFKKYAHKR